MKEETDVTASFGLSSFYPAVVETTVVFSLVQVVAIITTAAGFGSYFCSAVAVTAAAVSRNRIKRKKVSPSGGTFFVKWKEKEREREKKRNLVRNFLAGSIGVAACLLFVAGSGSCIFI